jgi:fermentation-respiration switch protein FrsA (DUF1100 family)
VDHRKVTFNNRLGITLVADLYVAKTIDRSQRHPALVVGGPYGAVKEQSSGLYAQTMAERGYITIAHDPSYVGESGGQPHDTASAEALVEDFSAGVDFLAGCLRGPRTDRRPRRVRQWRFRAGGGGDRPRIKAVATVSMQTLARPNGRDSRQHWMRRAQEESRRGRGPALGRGGWRGAAMAIGTPQVLTASSTAIDREFYDYYAPRGQHPRSSTAFSRSSNAQMTLFWSYQHLDWISPRPVLFITGDQAHSRVFSEHAYGRASEPKELFIVPGAGHVDLYDRVNLIPWNKLQSPRHPPRRAGTIA